MVIRNHASSSLKCSHAMLDSTCNIWSGPPTQITTCLLQLLPSRIQIRIAKSDSSGTDCVFKLHISARNNLTVHDLPTNPIFLKEAIQVRRKFSLPASPRKVLI